jgi:hypothetical protein
MQQIGSAARNNLILAGGDVVILAIVPKAETILKIIAGMG